MPSLSMVHIGVHTSLANIPAFTGVPRLRSLTLAWLFAIHDLPPFDCLPDLQRLILTFLPQLEQLPDMAPLQSLSDFTVSRPVRLCCNGFAGTCNLSASYCASNATMGISAATCLRNDPYLGSVATQQVFNKFSATICQKLPSDGVILAGIPTRAAIEICDGKPFGECTLPSGGRGICYNVRMQVLSCYGDDNYIKLRQYQIQKRVGLPCNPHVEKWLGCGE